MKSQLNNALAFFQVVAIITNLSTFAIAKIQLFSAILNYYLKKNISLRRNSKQKNMLQDDLDEVKNLLERKRNYENCIKALKPFTGRKSIFNYQTGKYESISARCFAHLDRSETNKGTYEWGTLDERAEALLLPIFKQLLAEVDEEIAQIKINGVPDKEKHVKTMLSEEIQPMFKEPQNEEKVSGNPSAWVKWGVAIAIGFFLLLLLNLI